ncbi:hypothetical protein VTN31DRAFT_646 [Thermomyces dupontii]|uniref:uncharacterized protein n=1 Tax=Talaromyces thermophilus TaxID=28565 RepID=UPI00374381D7
MAAPNNETTSLRSVHDEPPPSTSRHDVENDKENASPDFGEGVDGSVRAWLVAFGASCIFFCALGYANSFGVFQEYYLSHQLQHRSPDDVAWVGSLAAFLQFAAGSIGGPLFDRFGAIVIHVSSVLYVFAIMMISLCTEYWHFMLAQGVLLGTAMGFLQFPAMAAVAQYFEKKKATALGVSFAGSSIGGIVFPIALSKMLNDSDLGFGWSVRIIGFIMIPLLAFSSLVVQARLPPRLGTLWILDAWRNPTYILLIVAFFFSLLGMYTPLFFIPTYAVTQGMDAEMASYLAAILNAASTFGRVIPGILADKFGKINIFAFGGILTGVVSFCLTEASSTAGLIVYSIAIGFTSGTIISGGAAAITVCFDDARESGAYLGMALATSSVAGLIGPPISGAFLHRYGDFFEASVFNGVMCLAGGFLALAMKATTSKGLLGRV